MVTRRRVTVVGAGHVGATLAHRLVEANQVDVVLLDILGDLARGKALDMLEAAPRRGYDSGIIGADNYAEAAGSAVVVITAGKPRQPGMDRMDLLKANAAIVKGVVERVKEHAPEAVLLMVTNPLDVMTYLALKVSGLPRHKVCGMAGALDSSRMAAFLAEKLEVSVCDIQPTVLGGHGDSMVPLPRYTTVAGIPVTEFLSEKELALIVERTRRAGAEIVGLLQSGSAFYAPSAGAAAMVESILGDQKRIIPSSVCLEGEYGLEDVCIGVPVKLGADGVEEVIELRLDPEERAALKRSAENVRSGIAALQEAEFL